MTDTKHPFPQINVRAPHEARDTLLRIGWLLRGNPSFLDHLTAFLDEYKGNEAGMSLEDRIASLDARVTELEASR